VADLHLEKASSGANRGRLLPPYDTRATLLKLAEAVDRYEAEAIIALGDSLHDSEAADRIPPDDRDLLALIQEERKWVWITGNHDPVIDPRLGGTVMAEIELNGLTLRHAPRQGAITREIAGHLHPAARVSLNRTRLRRPCFVGNGLRLVLPAFGVLTGGLNVLDEAVRTLFGDDGFAVWLLGDEGIYPIATRQLCDD
jgi:DNA ligase-associated metallophosphoesterase